MAWKTSVVLGMLLASLSLGSQFGVEKRDDCPSGTINLSGFEVIGGSFDVCCPGKGVTTNGITYCCIGQNNNGDKERGICIGDVLECSGDATSSCATAVPVTAGDFSQRVSSATAVMANQAAPTGVAESTSSSHGAAAGMITAAPLAALVMVAGGVMANAALL